MTVTTVAGHKAFRFVGENGTGGQLCIPIENASSWKGLIIGFTGTMSDYITTGTHNVEFLFGLQKGNTNWALDSSGPDYFFGLRISSLTFNGSTHTWTSNSMKVSRIVGTTVTTLYDETSHTLVFPSEACSPTQFTMYARIRRYDSSNFHVQFGAPKSIWVTGATYEGGHEYTNGEVVLSQIHDNVRSPYFFLADTGGSYENRAVSRDEDTYGTLDRIYIGLKSPTVPLRLYLYSVGYMELPGEYLSGKQT